MEIEIKSVKASSLTGKVEEDERPRIRCNVPPSEGSVNQQRATISEEEGSPDGGGTQE